MISGNRNITIGAIMKLIDGDYLPKEKDDWAKNTTNRMKAYLIVRIILQYTIF